MSIRDVAPEASDSRVSYIIYIGGVLGCCGENVKSRKGFGGCGYSTVVCVRYGIAPPGKLFTMALYGLCAVSSGATGNFHFCCACIKSASLRTSLYHRPETLHCNAHHQGPCPSPAKDPVAETFNCNRSRLHTGSLSSMRTH